MIFWAVFLPISIIGRITFNAPELEPLDYFMTKGMYNVFILFAIAGVLTSVLLFLAARQLSNLLHKENKILTALLKTAATAECVMFYVSCLFMLIINKDALAIASVIVWLVCVVLCSVMLIVSKTSSALQRKNN